LTPAQPDPSEEEIEEPGSEIEPIVHKPAELLEESVVENVCIDNSNVVLVGYFGRKVEMVGRLKVSNSRLVFLMGENEHEEVLLEVPLGLLLKVERSSEDKFCFSLEVFIKYGSSFRIKYPDSDLSAKSQRLLAHLIETSLELAYEYGSRTAPELKCLLFCPAHCEEVKDAYWYDNQGWKKMLNYP
jgi:hypothetical protein